MGSLEGQWLAAVTHLVTQTEPPARLLALEAKRAVLAMADGSLATVHLVHGEPEPEVEERMRFVIDKNPHTHLKLVIVGGDPDTARTLLRQCQPRLSMRRAVQVFHLTADGEVWAGSGSRADSPLGKALAAAHALARSDDPPTRERLTELVQPPPKPAPEEAERIEQGQAFIDRIRGTRPRVVWGLLAVIAVVYGLEELWGGSEFAPTLVRMGANRPDMVFDEPWRLASSVLLHAGIVHAAINGFVLVVLGGFLERIIGGPRLILLLVVSGIAGSIASATAGMASLSVGASGAIWGALGASGVFALKPSGVIPEAVVPSIRRAAISNLVINLTVSFLPEVDLWAHLGGGIAGALLVLTGALTRGLPGADDRDHGALPTASRPLKIVAGASLGLLVAGLLAAFAIGRPWVLSAPPQYETRTIGEGSTALTIEVPSYLAPAETFDHQGLPAYIVGDILADPVAFVIVVEPHDLSDAERSLALQEVAEADPPTPEGGTVDEPWGPSAIGTNAYSVDYHYDNGIRAQMWYQIQDRVRVRVDTTWWSDAPSDHRAAAEHAIESIAQ